MANPANFTPTVGSTYYGATPATAKNQLTMSTFITLLTAQLSAQDPTQPLSSDQMAAQISELGQMQAMQTMNQDAQMQQAQGMIGQVITAPNPNSTGPGSNLTVTGTVVGVSLSNGSYNLNLLEPSGSTVTVPASTVSGVSPSVDLSQLSSLINHIVTGNVTTTTNGNTSTQSETGLVLGISQSNGIGMLSVQTSNGTVQIPANQLTQINK